MKAVDDLGERLGSVVAAIVDLPGAVLIAPALDAIEEGLDDGAFVFDEVRDPASDQGPVAELAGDLERREGVGERAVG